ncbi:MAG: DUF3124 domain-containing protein [Myxococcota bacterium]
MKTRWMALAVCLAACEPTTRPPLDSPSVPAEALDPAALRALSPGADTGGIVYVSTYGGPATSTRHLGFTITLTVHNTSLDRELHVPSIMYVDREGAPQRAFLSEPLRLGPLAAKNFSLQPKTYAEGNGAAFLVKWEGPEGIPNPLIEALMLTTEGQQGISFITRGQEVERLSPPAT